MRTDAAQRLFETEAVSAYRARLRERVLTYRAGAVHSEGLRAEGGVAALDLVLGFIDEGGSDDPRD